MKKAHNLLSRILPQRVVLGIMGFLAIASSYTIRACLSAAINEMVVKDGNHEGNKLGGDKYDWNEKQQGWILSAFYVGYVITHIPGGLLAQKFGGKWVMGLGILIMAVLNALTPLAVSYGGYVALIIVRVLMGLGGGTTYPALSVLLAAWVPEKERGKLGSVIFGGGQIGSLLSFFVSGVLLDKFNWSFVFYFWSGISFVWFALFTFTCYNDPGSHPFITDKERDYLKSEMGQIKRNDDLPSTPWLSILTSVPVLALTCAQIGHDWVFYIISAELPKYFKDVIKIENNTEIGIYSSLPYLAMWIVSIASGFLSDFLTSRKYVTTTQARKIFTSLGAIPPAIFIVGASYAGYNKAIVATMFTLAVGFLGNFYPGLKVNALDLSPNYAGSLMALTNGIGGLTGIAVAPFVGFMIPQSTLEQWRVVFWVTFGISMVRIVIFDIWGSAEVQPWNNPLKKNASPESGVKDENRQAADGNKAASRRY